MAERQAIDRRHGEPTLGPASQPPSGAGGHFIPASVWMLNQVAALCHEIGVIVVICDFNAAGRKDRT
jgi:hypothetical protein